MASNQEDEKQQGGQQTPSGNNNGGTNQSQTPPTGNPSGGGAGKPSGPPTNPPTNPPTSGSDGNGGGSGNGGTAVPPASGQPSGQGNEGKGNEGGNDAPQPDAPQPDAPQPDAPQSDAPQPSQQPYSQFNGNSYEDVENFIRQQMAGYPQETEEERKKRERHERRTRSLAAIADILGTMHKAYSYQRGVAPMDLPDMTEKAQALYDKTRAERDKDKDRYVNYALTLGNLKDKDRNFNFRIEKAKLSQAAVDAAEKRAEAKEHRDAALHELSARLAEGKIGEQEAKTRKAEIDADYADQVQQSIIDRNKASAEAGRASAEASRATAADRRNSTASRNQFMAYDRKGRRHYFSTEAAARYFARQNGTWYEDYSEEHVKEEGGGKLTPKERTTSKPNGGHSIDPTKWASGLKL